MSQRSNISKNDYNATKTIDHANQGKYDKLERSQDLYQKIKPQGSPKAF